ncbi:hypothetical protein POPTR_006G250550v4 [Populus trichocarpa]|uniref:Uncharacterized protein n=1 Tax=Populus trichocarpa TaxID=3694 RepID=A0ACC0SWC2_POPTR|nr:hypothetical protein POPTR_006G250550v4 [Populus trichocarpa]
MPIASHLSFHGVSRLLLMNPCIFQGQSRRHANFASRGLKMMLGTCGSPSFFWFIELGAVCAGIMCRVLDEVRSEL